jgi:hypothetical protein
MNIKHSELLIYEVQTMNYLLKICCLQMALTFVFNLSVITDAPLAMEAYK